jgi:hypothetical protein
MSLDTAEVSGAGNDIFLDIKNGAGLSIFNTLPYIPAATKTSVGMAASAGVLNPARVNIADDEELQFQVATGYTGTTARGLKAAIIGTRSLLTGPPSAGTDLSGVTSTGLSNGATNGSVVLTMTAPAANGGIITGYKVEAKATSASVWSTAASSVGSLPTTVTTVNGSTSLSVGTSYDFRVSGINVAGTGLPSNFVSVTPLALTSAPASLNAVPGNNSAVLTWTAPSNLGGAASVNSYVVEAKPSSASAWTTATTVGGGTLTATVLAYDVTSVGTNLVNGTSYDFRVRAVTAAGSSLPITSANVTPTSAGAVPTYRAFAFAEKPAGSSFSTFISANNSGVTSFTSIPQGGDLIVMVVACPVDINVEVFPGTVTSLVDGSAFTQFGSEFIGGLNRYRVYTKVAGGSGGSSTTDTLYSVGGSSNWSGVINVWAVQNASAIDVLSGTMNQVNSDPASPSVSVSGSNDLLLSLAYWLKVGGTAPTTPSGMTLQRNGLNYNSSGSLGPGWNYSLARQALSGSGFVSSKTWTVTAPKPDAWDALTIAVK